MRVTAVVYEWFFWKEIKKNIDINLQSEPVQFFLEVESFSYCRFSVGIDENFNQWDRIVFYEQDWVNSRRIFSWYVYKSTPILTWFTAYNQIECREEKQYTFERILIWWKWGISNSSTYSELLESIQQDYNSKWDSRWISTIQWSTRYWKAAWTTYFDFFDWLAQQTDNERTVRDGVVIFKNRIWEDKTTWTNLQEAFLSPWAWNISSLSVSTTWLVPNAIYVTNNQSQWWFFPNPAPNRVTWVIYERVDTTDLESAALNILQKQSEWVVNYFVSIDQWSIDATINDSILLRIEGISDNIDITSSVFVVWKTVTYQDAQKVETFQLWNVPRMIKNWTQYIQETFNRINRNISDLQTQ